MRLRSLLRASALASAVGVGAAQRRLPEHRELQVDAASDANAARELVEDGEDEEDETAVDDLVQGAMPGLSDKIELTHHAGRIPLDNSKRNKIFYWHFVAAANPDKAPLVVWLNGGPGCSSMQGLFLGISPFTIESETKVSINKHSWHHTANVLFIDQPVGTGMSFTRGNDYRTDEESVAKDFHTVITKFFERHPEYLTVPDGNGVQVSRDFYIFGESHAGRFIPEFSDYIVAQNKVAYEKGGTVVNLKGIGIGNGWVHPLIQYEYSDFAHGLGLLTFGQVRALKTQFADCQNALLSGKYLTPSCFQNMNSIIGSIKNAGVLNQKTLNFYDVRQYVHSVSAYPHQRKFIREYMNQMEVRKLLHANTASNFNFRDCSDEVYDGLRSFDGVSTLDTVQRLLRGGLRVLFYNGQWDMMCNHYGTEKLLLHLDWNGSASYQEAKKYTWSVSDRSEPAGFAQGGGNLTYIVIPGAGHMVPMDVPDVAAEMMKRFVMNQPFDDSPQQVNSLKTNITNFETTQCVVPVVAAAKTSSVNLTWLWVGLVVAVIGGVLMFCVTVMWRRSKKARHSEHSVIIQESDEEEAMDHEKGLEQDDDDRDSDSDEEFKEVAIRSRG